MSCENCEESAYVIDKLAKLLAEIAVIVNGPEPPLTRWSYHDLPEKVRALRQAQQPAAAVPAGGLRDSVLNSAKFRASCYALVGIVEGIAGLGRRWASDGERLKDTPEWVAFYNSVSAMRNGTSAKQAPPAAVPAGYDEDEIADACMMAEVSDSKYEAVITYLSYNRRAMLTAANKNKETDTWCDS